MEQTGSSKGEPKGPTENGARAGEVPCDPVSIPDHQLLRCIGRGSYGTVWLARNTLGAYRAVKIVYRSSFTRQRPFEREWSGICKFEPISRSHEGLIDVLHVGINEAQGFFYYVMELGDDCDAGQDFDPERYVPKTLAQEISRRGALGVQDCLRLGLALSDALTQLHQRGLVHRDIKPSNIIFVNGVPKLADIGLVARADDPRSYVGTEGFIPPEGPGTQQADVYSLGKVLYEACTGRDRQDFPELPTQVEELADRDRFLELNETILHACRNETDRRYQTASDMHADLVVVANGKSVKRLRVLERRLSTMRRAAGIAGLALIVAGIFAYPAYQEWRLRLETRQRNVGAHIAYGVQALEAGDLLGSLPHFTEALRLDQDIPDRIPTHRLRFGAVLAQTATLTTLWPAECAAYSGDFSADGNTVLVSLVCGSPRLYDLRTGQQTQLPIKVSHSVSAQFAPDGRSMIVASQEKNVSVWDVATGRELLRLPHPQGSSSARFGPQGLHIVTACEDGFVRLWSASSGQVEHRFGPYPQRVRFCTFSHNGEFVAIAGEDRTCRVWNTNGSPASPLLTHESWVSYAAFSPDDRLLVTAGWDRRARVWELPAGKRLRPDLLHSAGVTSAEFSPDGRLIVTASADGTVRLWDADTQRPCEGDSVLQHGRPVNHASFAPDAHRVLTACTDGSVRVWDLAGAVLPPQPLAISPSGDGSRYLTVSNQTVCVREALSARTVSEFYAGAGLIGQPQLNRNGRFVWGIAAAEHGGARGPAQVLVWNAETGKEEPTGISFTNRVSGATISDDGGRIGLSGGRLAMVWDLRARTPLSPPLVQRHHVSGAIFSPNGAHLALRTGNTVQVWDCTRKDFPFAPIEHPAPVTDVEFSPDGTLLATSCADQWANKCSARIWNTATGQPEGPPLEHGDGVLGVAFSPDGKRLVTASEDSTAMIWEPRTGRQLTPALRHDNQVMCAAFSPNGRWVVTASADRTARVWDAASGNPVVPGLRHLAALSNAEFLSDGRTLLVADVNRNVWRWPLPVDPRPLEDLSAMARLLSGGPDASNGSAQPEPLEGLWQRLRTKYPADFTVTPENAVSWHQFQATECASHQKWFAAAFHLNQLLLAQPTDESIRRRLASAQQHLSESN